MNDALISLIWILAACLWTFLIPAFAAGWLKLPRNLYLLFYIPLGGLFAVSYFLRSEQQLFALFGRNPGWGLLAAALTTAFVMRNVFSQPPSERRKGPSLAIDILWPGFLYGLVDVTLLTLFPVLAVSGALGGPARTLDIGSGLLALLASLAVTASYHLGYPEYRGKKLLGPLLGNSIISIAFILTLNPLAAIIPHVSMHIAAMIHGRETTGQVPPHYE